MTTTSPGPGSDPTGAGRPVPEVMTAVRVHEFGDLDRAQLDRDVPVPVPGRGEVQMRVRAAGVNPLDWKVREGYLRAFVPHELPLTLGWDLAGRVTEVGPGVGGLAVGDEVFGRPATLRGGAFAEYAVVPEGELAAAPTGLSPITAAALPLAATTAVQAFELAGLQRGQRVLVHAAAGGVGHLAVQVARHLEARVVATALPQDRDFVRDELGVVDVVTPSPAAADELRALAPDGYDVVLDLLGGPTYTMSLDLLRPGGVVVTTVAFPDAEDLRTRGVRAVFLDNDADTARLATVAALARDGHLRPHIHDVLPLERVREAFSRSQSGTVRGKLVLDIDSTAPSSDPAGGAR